MANGSDPRVQEIHWLLHDLRDARGGKPFSPRQIAKLTATLKRTLREIFQAGLETGLGEGQSAGRPRRSRSPARRRPRPQLRPSPGT